MSAKSSDDWRDCELCRDWKGKEPIPPAEVRKDLTPEMGFTVSHACYFYRDEDGEIRCIPTTVAESPDDRLQWFPELPDGHRPMGA